MKLKIEYLPLEKLEEYKNNARKHGEEDITALKRSIKQFGFDDPIGIWSDHNVIVKGHGRFRAAQELGMTEVPCIRLDHLSDEERRAYALAHNRTAELSNWDFAIREAELADIMDIDMSAFGFDNELVDPNALDDFFTPAEPKEKSEPKQIQCPHCGEWFTP